MSLEDMTGGKSPSSDACSTTVCVVSRHLVLSDDNDAKFFKKNVLVQASCRIF